MGTISVSPATTRATTDSERTKISSFKLIATASSPRGTDFVSDLVTNVALRNPALFRPNLRLRRSRSLAAIGLWGRYWVGYHPQWFPTLRENTGYGVNSDPAQPRILPDRARSASTIVRGALGTFAVDKRNKTL